MAMFTCVTGRVRPTSMASVPRVTVWLLARSMGASLAECVVNVMLLGTDRNPRPELSAKCWPNLKVVNLHVVAPSGVSTLNLYHPTGTMSELDIPVEYISQVSVKGTSFVRPNGKPTSLNVRLSSRKFQTSKSLSFEVE